MTARVECADVLAWAASYDGPPFHAMLCDPPYELGFMGKGWDRTGIAFDPATWAALAVHLHPGAFGMAFASSRGWHRLAVAIEDAGLTIHPSIFGWAFGSGFPKATRIDTQIDRAAGAERPPEADRWTANHPTPDVDGYSGNMHAGTRTAPATPLAAAWGGHRYGGQALKPALEPIIVFQKPYAGRPVDSITATGAGALNIDGARVPTGDKLGGGAESGPTPVHEGWHRPWRDDPEAGAAFAARVRANVQHAHPAGRWPANFIACHLPECNGVCTPGCPVAALGAQSGELVSGKPAGSRNAKTGFASGITPGAVNLTGFGDRGTCARFFHNPDYALDVAEQLAAAEPVRYVAKASRRERNAGCEGLPTTTAQSVALGDRAYGTLPYTNEPREMRPLPRANGHPTVKPLALAQHLATLLLPPDAYAPRRLFVPFAGSGSEMIGATLAGWEDVVGIERESDYADIARARLAWWDANRDKTGGEPVAMTRAEPRHGGGADIRGGRFAAKDAIDRHAPPPRGATLAQPALFEAAP